MTTLVRFREPLRNFSMNAEFERLINTVFESPARSAQAWTPPLDVWETEDDLVYAFDMPGIPEEKIAVEIEDDTLTVSGSRERAEKVEDERFFRYERRFGDFTRSVALPQGCGEGEAQARQWDARSPRQEAGTVQAPAGPGADDRRGGSAV
jgi:HSP20 family molecular chaperone IbpA